MNACWHELWMPGSHGSGCHANMSEHRKGMGSIIVLTRKRSHKNHFLIGSDDETEGLSVIPSMNLVTTRDGISGIENFKLPSMIKVAFNRTMLCTRFDVRSDSHSKRDVQTNNFQGLDEISSQSAISFLGTSRTMVPILQPCTCRPFRGCPEKRKSKAGEVRSDSAAVTCGHSPNNFLISDFNR